MKEAFVCRKKKYSQHHQGKICFYWRAKGKIWQMRRNGDKLQCFMFCLNLIGNCQQFRTILWLQTLTLLIFYSSVVQNNQWQSEKCMSDCCLAGFHQSLLSVCSEQSRKPHLPTTSDFLSPEYLFCVFVFILNSLSLTVVNCTHLCPGRALGAGTLWALSQLGFTFLELELHKKRIKLTLQPLVKL